MEASDAAARVFGLRDFIVVAVRHVGPGIFTAGGLGRIESLSRDLAACDGIVASSVASLSTAPRLQVRDDAIDLRPLLSRTAPIDEGLIRQLRDETAALGLDDGVLVSADGRAAAIYAEIEPDADRQALRRRVSAIAERASGDGYEVFLSGTALAQAVLGEAAVTDLARLIPLVIAIVGAFLFVAFRHPVPAIVTLAEVAVSVLWTAGLMGLFRQRVFVTTLSLPVILLVIGVSDDLYALNQYFAERRRRPLADVATSVETAFDAIRKPVTLTAITTILGLLSLVTTSIEPQRVFGVFGAVSVFFSTVFTFTLVPALLMLFGAPVAEMRRPPGRAAAERCLGLAMAWLERVGHARVLICTAAIGCVAAIIGFQVRVEDSWIGNLPRSSDVVRGDRAINASLAGTNTLELLFETDAADGYLDPERLAALGAVERIVADNRHVGAVQSTYSEVVRTIAALESEPYRQYRDDLTRGTRRLERSDVLQAVVLRESLERSPMVPRLDATRRRARMTVFVHGANYSVIADVLRAVREADHDMHGRAGRITPFGDGWIGYKTIDLIVAGQVSSIAFATVADMGTLTILFMSLRVAAVAITPVIIALALLFAALAATGTALGTASSMFAAIALSIGADYSIHLVATCRERLADGMTRREAVQSAVLGTGPAILMSAVALPAGFIVLALSAVQPNRELGSLIASSMIVCAVLTLVVVPALMTVGFGDPRPILPVWRRRIRLLRGHGEDGQFGSPRVDRDGRHERV